MMILAVIALALAACSEPFIGQRPVINSGSYDWTDQVRDAQGYPLPGWANAIGPNAGSTGPM